MTSKNTKTFEFRLGRTALILFVMGMSCLVFVAFVGGVLVGKHIDTYPEKIARGIPAKIVRGEGKPSAAAPAQSPLPASAVPAAKVPPRPASATPVAEAPAAAETRPQQAAESGREGRPSASGPGAAAEKAVSPEKKNAVKEPAKTVPGQAPTAATAPADVKGKYLLQVASYKEKEKAEQVAGKLGAMGYAPRVVATDLREKGIWYRVQVSGFATREEAQRASEAIAAKMSGVRSAMKPSLKGN